MSDNFNFDLERMKIAVEAPIYYPPSGLSFEEFREWVKKINNNVETIGELKCQQQLA
jgi:hypothetical protein